MDNGRDKPSIKREANDIYLKIIPKTLKKKKKKSYYYYLMTPAGFNDENDDHQVLFSFSLYQVSRVAVGVVGTVPSWLLLFNFFVFVLFFSGRITTTKRGSKAG